MRKTPILIKPVHVLLMCIGLLPSLLSTQTLPDKVAFEKYGVAEGLPEEMAVNLVQDRQGFIWATTQNGLVKFDGYQMKVIKSWQEKDTTYHIRNLNGGLLLSRNGKLWIGGVREGTGLFSFNPETETFTTYPIDYDDPTKTPYNNCFLLYEDLSNHIWFNSISDGEEDPVLCRLNPETGIVSRYPQTVRQGRINDIVLNFKLAESQKDSSLWLREDKGNVMRFERKKDSFELIFKKGEVLPGTDRNDSIQDITPPGKSGLIPMGNNRHLYLWDPLEQKVVETFDFPSREAVEWQGTAFEDLHGNIWNSSYDEISRIDRKNAQRSDYKIGQGVLAFDKTLKNIRSIIPSYQDLDFIVFNVNSTDRGLVALLRYTFSDGAFHLYDLGFNDAENAFAKNGFRYNLLRDKSGLFWVGTRPNMYKQAPKKRQITSFRNDPEDLSRLPNDTIWTFFEDSRERLWVGTQNGIAQKIGENTFRQYFIGPGNEGKNSLGDINQIYEDSQGRIWVCAIDKGLLRFNEQTLSYESIPFLEDKEVNVIRMAEDGNGNLWLSAIRKGVYILDPDTGMVIKRFEPEGADTHLLSSNVIVKIFKDSKNQIWLGDPRDNDQALFKYVEEKEQFEHYRFDAQDTLTLSSNEILFMTEDDRGRMWVGTDGGLNLYERDNDIFHRNLDLMSLPSVPGFHQAGNGKMWFTAYSGEGLALVGPGVNDVEVFGEDIGLLHNDVVTNWGEGKLLMDDFGKLWLPTQRGLSVFDTTTKTYSSYFEADGYQQYTGVHSSIKTKKGDIWIGGDQGLYHIIPEKLAAKDSTLPNVVITRIGIQDSVYNSADGVLFEKAVPYTQAVTLDHTQRDLSFEFVALHYLKPEDNLYSWKLENYDTKWSEPSLDRRVSYKNLSPGTYLFRVRGSNADGVWNEEGASMAITIRPPWWQTGWAYFLYLLLVGFIGYRLHLFQKQRTIRKERERAREKELEQAKEIEKAYAELKATQSQLIQSEKMASLGELTAGIAHEIQNPLNFVNNFSELNMELLEELDEETGKGNLKEVQNLTKDIKENELKINHHGKRADSIVKGMLQHSRSSDGQKELTDINVLADEYVRLAYHGLRARDKSFNATFKTDLDSSIGKVNIVPQEIGRVVLNLLNNAFYAVNEKKQTTQKEYSPTVSLITKKTKNGIEIQVSDNGKGMPEEVRNKVFQPFFTTKPTGQGTGLGLSLSYDIIKAHGGTLEVKSEEGKGTEFIIKLPVA
ncbi:two-component regulator propeller domain-containing protein [Robiginitalea aurantiaca]|uniref:histidine kinase n=1 Tax=Robiginitalea aurantiaca TaxID=3056915 RepID=A0ABT7WDF0_9FLAO|nr:two-component regulator propeller domain-containing protein [Robiginitalea aurantiaca]MDM9630944.1 two-component regulator propeller domain-containing protein [Robiginitalea aurantiaca]